MKQKIEEKSHITLHTSQNKGITLVALIITIVVLLILAVVAIREISGEGIIAYAIEARNKHKEEQEKEEIKLALNEWKLVGITNPETTFLDFMKEKFGAKNVTSNGGNSVIVTMESGNQYIVSENGTITKLGEGYELNEYGFYYGVPYITEGSDMAVVFYSNGKCELFGASSSGSPLFNGAIEYGNTTFTIDDEGIKIYSGNQVIASCTISENGASLSVLYGEDNIEVICNFTQIPHGVYVGEIYEGEYNSQRISMVVNSDGLISGTLGEQNLELTWTYLNEWNLWDPDSNEENQNFIIFSLDGTKAFVKYYNVGVMLELRAKGIALSANEMTLLSEGNVATQTLTASLNGIEGEISWSIPDESVIKISGTTGESITVTAVAEGETTITATCGSYTASCVVTVEIDHSEVVVGTIAKTGVFANNPYIAEVREGDIPIPTGFTYVKGDKKGGAVITDGINEFVWVPTTADIVAYELNTANFREPDVVTGVTPSATVDSASGSSYDAANLTEAGCTQDLNNDGRVNAYDFKIQLTNEFNEMATSVNKYDGFYVGRYEMSYDGTAKSVSGVESAMNKTSDYDWYGLYAKAKTYTNSGNSVVSRMIYGSQYDAMMTWMGSAANNNIGDNRNRTRTTGTCPTDKVNNIYDLYGNSLEWTQEAYGTGGRVNRGGYYNLSYSPSDRNSNIPTYTYSSGMLGSRLTLYIK